MSHNHYLMERYCGRVHFGLDKLNSYYKPHTPVVLKNETQYFIKKNIKFIYPIQIFNSSIFVKSPPKLSSAVIKACNTGLCKVGIMYDTEGHETNTRNDFADYEIFEWFEKFAIKNKLDFTNFFFAHGNRKLSKIYLNYLKGKSKNLTVPVEPKITILKYSYFQDFLWFLYNGRRPLPTRKEIFEHFIEILLNNREVKKVKHFLCLNRVPRTGRLLIFAVIASNDDLDNKSILSIGTGESAPHRSTSNHVNMNFQGELPPPLLQDFMNSYNFEESKHVLDNKKDSNEAFGINFDFHQTSFLNIVTETLNDGKTIFFTEKIFKPMYMLQPFILIGSQHSLRELKTLGYKTFDKWWDESYDEEDKLVERVLKIEKVLKKLSKLSTDELHVMTLAMEDTLIHNYSVLLFEPKQESLDYYSFLSFNEASKEKLTYKTPKILEQKSEYQKALDKIVKVENKKPLPPGII